MMPTSEPTNVPPSQVTRAGLFLRRHGPALCLALALVTIFVWRVAFLQAHGYVSNDTKSYLVSMQQVFGHDFTGRGLQRPPLVMIMLRPLVLIWGEIQGSRLLSVLIYVGIGWPFYLLARRIVNPWVAAWAAVLLVLSPMYSEMLSWGYITFFGIFFSLFAFHFILRAWECRRWRTVLMAGLMSSLVMGVHQTSFIIFVAMTGVLAILVWLTRWVARRDAFVTMLLVILAGIVFALPYVPSYLSQTTNLSGDYVPSLIRLRTWSQVTLMWYMFVTRHCWLWIAALVAIVPGLIRLARGRTHQERGVALVLLAMTLAVLGFNSLDSADLAARSLYFEFAVVWMVWAVGVQQIAAWVRRFAAARGGLHYAVRALSTVAVCGMLVLGGYYSQRHLAESSEYYNTLDPDQLVALSWMKDHLEPDGLIITRPNGFSYWIGALLGRKATSATTATRGAWKEEGQDNQIAMAALSGNESIDNGSLRFFTGYPYYAATDLVLAGYVDYAGVGAQSIEIMAWDEEQIELTDPTGVWGANDVTATQVGSEEAHDALSMWAVRQWDGLTIERRATLVQGQRQATIEYRLAIPPDRLPLRLTMPVTLKWCQVESRDVAVRDLTVLAREARPSGEMDYTITATLDGAGEGSLMQQDCVLQYVWDLDSENVVIRYQVDVTSPGASVNAVIPHAEAVDLLRGNDVRYLAIDETPSFVGDESLSAYTTGWFNAAPYYYPVYRDLGVTVYRVDEDVLSGPGQTVDCVLASGDVDDPELALLGWRLLGSARPGELCTVALYWQGRQPIEVNYAAFVHLGDATSVLAQSDGVPCNQGNPTTVWAPGQTVIDLHSMRLPADLAPGSYQLAAGLYAVDGGGRLPAYTAAGQRWSGDEVPLGTIEVAP